MQRQRAFGREEDVSEEDKKDAVENKVHEEEIKFEPRKCYKEDTSQTNALSRRIRAVLASNLSDKPNPSLIRPEYPSRDLTPRQII